LDEREQNNSKHTGLRRRRVYMHKKRERRGGH